MSRSLLLKVAAFLTLFTFVGHSIGGLSGPPAEQAEAFQVYEQMKQTLVVMPFGSPKSLARMDFGANLCLSFFLLASGLIFVLVALSKEKATRLETRILLVNSLGMLGVGIVSALCFFPLPAACTGIAGVLGLIAASKS